MKALIWKDASRPSTLVCAGLLSIASLTVAPVARAQAEACAPTSSSHALAEGVLHYDCTDKSPAVHIVTIARSLKDVELRLIGKRRENDAPNFTLDTLTTLASDARAVVAINGGIWSGDRGLCGVLSPPFLCGGVGTPDLTVYWDGEPWHVSSNPEVLMGFSSDSDGIHVMSSEDTDVQNDWIYGSDTPIVRNKIFIPNDLGRDNQSVVGYSDTHILFLVGRSILLNELEATLLNFDITKAVRNDGGSSSRLVGRDGLDFDASGRGRNIAFGLALVPKVQQDVECFVFNDGYADRAGPSDAIYFNGPRRACIVDGAGRLACRKWFGQCRTRGENKPVLFETFDDGHTNASAPADAVYIRGPRQACVSNGTSDGECHKWFGEPAVVGPETGSGRVTCLLFENGYTYPTLPSRSFYYPSRDSVCLPNGTSDGLRRKWFGRCRAE